MWCSMGLGTEDPKIPRHEILENKLASFVQITAHNLFDDNHHGAIHRKEAQSR